MPPQPPAQPRDLSDPAAPRVSLGEQDPLWVVPGPSQGHRSVCSAAEMVLWLATQGRGPGPGPPALASSLFKISPWLCFWAGDPRELARGRQDPGLEGRAWWGAGGAVLTAPPLWPAGPGGCREADVAGQSMVAEKPPGVRSWGGWRAGWPRAHRHQAGTDASSGVRHSHWLRHTCGIARRSDPS